MNAIECSGKTVQEAVSKALAESGWSLGEIEYEVVQEESKGILGIGAKPAVVRVTHVSDDKEALPPQRRKEAREVKQARDERNHQTARLPRQAPRAATGVAPEAPIPEVAFDAVDPNEHPAGQFLSKLLTLMQIEPLLRMSKHDDVLHVEVLSQQMGEMIGQRGETLDAIQYLTALVINKGEHEYTRVMLDTQNYRAKREAALQNLARRLASRARHSGRRVVLEPMNPYERRVMHAALQNSPYVKTHSEGVEPNRRVVIEPADAKDVR